MESPVIQRVWIAKTLGNEFLGVYDSEETAKTMLSDTPINMCISEYIVANAEYAKEKQVKIEVDLGVRLCKHIVLPSPFCESLPDKLLDGAEIKKKWEKYCNEMDACNREIECVLKEKNIPHFVSVKEALVEIQVEERLTSPKIPPTLGINKHQRDPNMAFDCMDPEEFKKLDADARRFAQMFTSSYNLAPDLKSGPPCPRM
jgi:hypothetical protein